MKKLFKGIYRYTLSMGFGAVMAPVLVYNLRKMEEKRLEQLFVVLTRALTDFFTDDDYTRDLLKPLYITLRRRGLVSDVDQPLAASDATTAEARERLLVYLKQEKTDICLCPSCLYNAMAGRTEVDEVHPN